MELRFLQRSSGLLGVPNPSRAISLAVIALVLSSLPWSRMTGTRILASRDCSLWRSRCCGARGRLVWGAWHCLLRCRQQLWQSSLQVPRQLWTDLALLSHWSLDRCWPFLCSCHWGMAGMFWNVMEWLTHKHSELEFFIMPPPQEPLLVARTKQI